MVSLLLAGGVALIVSLIGTPLLIGSLKARGIGQQIREDGPSGHVTKAGTPTMGGLVIVAAAVLGYAAGHLRSASRGHVKVTAVFTTPGLTVIFTMLGAALVGLIDDWIKVHQHRNLGLNKRTKILGLLVVGFGFALLATQWVHVRTDISFTRISSFSIYLSTAAWIVFAVLVVIGSANAVNLTDGLDGLAAGSSVFAFSALAVIAFWEFRHTVFYHVPHAANALDLAMISAGMVGGCAGFLWWNAAPAQIFMGDVGVAGGGDAAPGAGEHVGDQHRHGGLAVGTRDRHDRQIRPSGGQLELAPYRDTGPGRQVEHRVAGGHAGAREHDARAADEGVELVARRRRDQRHPELGRRRVSRRSGPVIGDDHRVPALEQPAADRLPGDGQADHKGVVRHAVGRRPIRRRARRHQSTPPSEMKL